MLVERIGESGVPIKTISIQIASNIIVYGKKIGLYYETDDEI